MATVLYDTFYGMKGWSGTAPGSSLYSLQESSGFEPADWNEPEVAQRSGGACGPFAWDGGEQWFVGASRAGLYLFVGGQPGKICQEIQPIWDALDWKDASSVASISVDVNLKERRMLIGVPMVTPNFWLPYAPPSAVSYDATHILSVQLGSHGVQYDVTVTFAETLPPLIPGQTYSFSGFTAFPVMNTLAPQTPIAVSGNTAVFRLVLVGAIDSAETGQAIIMPTQPLAPNVWLMCNFQGLDTGEEIRSEPQMHTTMFGTLAAIDMRRKWNIWYSATRPATIALVQGLNGEETRFGNGIGNSKIYALDPTATTDDGNVIDSCYTTSGFPLLSKRAEMMQLGPSRVRTSYLIAALTSGGLINLRMLANRLFFPEPDGYVQWTVPGGFTPGEQPLEDVNCTANFPAIRNFLEFRQNDGNGGWTLSNLILKMKRDVWNQVTGQK